MQQFVVDQNLILLDGKPLAFVTKAGLREWHAQGLDFTCRYDRILDPGENNGNIGACMKETDRRKPTCWSIRRLRLKDSACSWSIIHHARCTDRQALTRARPLPHRNQHRGSR